MDEMYKGIPFSPPVALADSIGPADTVIKVTDITAFPDGPNYATIGTDEEGETIFYAAKTFDSLSGCMRGIEGTAKSWPLGSTIARNFTNKDFETIQKNIQELTSLLDAIKDDIPKSADDLNALPIAGGTMEGPLHMNGKVLDGLNDPTEPDEAVRKAYVDKSVRKSAPVNLLDNSDFTQFVAQAGLGGKHGNDNYAGDRWITNMTVSGEKNQSGAGFGNILFTSVGVVSDIFQKFANYARIEGQRYTAAIMDNTDTIYCAAFNVGQLSSIPASFGAFQFYSTPEQHFLLRLPSGSGGIKWAMCIPGEYKLETLPVYKSKGYAAELLECQRYFQGVACGTVRSVPTAGVGQLFARTEVPMRLLNPTALLISGGLVLTGVGNPAISTVTSAVITNEGFGNEYLVGITIDGLPTTNWFNGYNWVSGDIRLVADL